MTAVEPDVAHHHLARPWGTQHVVTAGPLDGPVVVLVHGWPQHWRAWRHVLGPLSAEARVVAVDLRAFGWSTSEAPGRVQVGDLAADLVRTLDDLGIERAHLVGHDWGGWIAFRAVLDHADRWSGLSALAITPPWLGAAAMARRVLGWGYVVPMAVAGHAVAGRPGAVRWMVRRTTKVPVWDGADGEEALRSYAERVGGPQATAMTRRLYAALVARELPAALGSRAGCLSVPTTVVVGEHESISRPELYWSRTHPGELRVVVVHGAGHWLPEERPDAVVDHVRAVISSAA